jgi:hypothetical protein
MPFEKSSFQQPRGTVGELAQQRLQEDGEHDDIGLHKLACVHCEVADAGRSAMVSATIRVSQVIPRANLTQPLLKAGLRERRRS